MERRKWCGQEDGDRIGGNRLVRRSADRHGVAQTQYYCWEEGWTALFTLEGVLTETGQVMFLTLPELLDVPIGRVDPRRCGTWLHVVEPDCVAETLWRG